MRLPLAAVGAVVAALIETSVLSDLKVAGAKPDLVFVLAVVSALVFGVEAGLLWAFLGGLMLDMLLPERPVGSTILALLLCVGVALLPSRLLHEARIAVSVASVFVLTWLYHVVGAALLAATTGSNVLASTLGTILPIAVLNSVLALVVGITARALAIRYRPHDRLEYR
jgi:rod shape-determining protein MreD